MSKVFCISDLHFPYTNHEALKKVYAHIEEEKPDIVLQVGDLIDQYTFSHFNKDAGITPKMDVSRGLILARRMWEKIQDLAPKAECFQLLGNHDVRMAKRIAEKLPELSSFFSTKDLYVFDGVEVCKSDRDYLVFDGVVYCHGWLGQLGAHINHFRGKSVVHGHSHRLGVMYKGESFEMDVGHTANIHSTALSYSASKFTNWKMGCGIVDDGIPRIIPL